MCLDIFNRFTLKKYFGKLISSSSRVNGCRVHEYTFLSRIHNQYVPFHPNLWGWERKQMQFQKLFFFEHQTTDKTQKASNHDHDCCVFQIKAM
jgi:hypothetical protein